MSGFINSLEAAILDHVLLDTTYTPPTNWFVGLSSTTPGEDGSNFTEPSGGSYARVSTSAATWAAAAGGAPSTKANGVAITFAQATADWVSGADLTHFGLFAASSGGTVQIWGLLATAKPVLNGDTPSFAIGALIVKLGDPGDSY